jgi:phage tail sheath gpL-like
MDVSVTSGDLQTAIATNIAAAVNTQSKWPVTASVATNVVTITARQKGPRGNSLRISAQAIGSFTTTVSPTIPTALTGGTTADVATNALAAITAKRFYYQALAFEDATNIGLVVTQATANAAPTIGIRQRVFAGANDTTGSSAITLATGVNMNAVRAELVWQADSDLTPAEIAAHMAGIYALYEAQPRPRLNFNFYGDASSESWAIRAPRKGTAPTRPQILAALQNGVTPIASRSNGSAYLVKRITSRSLNGATQDYRIRDSHKVTVMDNYADDLAAKVAPLLVDAAIGDDPGPNDLPAPGVVTPRQIKAAASQLVGVYDDNGLVQNAAVIKASIVVQRSLVARTRMTGRIPIQTIDVLDQVGLELDQVA